MPTAQTATSELGFLGWGIEATAGTAVAPTDFIFFESENFNAKPDIITKTVGSGSRAANRVVTPALFKPAGQVTFPLYGTSHTPLLKGVLGLSTSISTSNLTTATSANVTTAGLTTLTMASTASLQQGQWILLGANSQSLQEPRQVLSLSPTTIVVQASVNYQTTAAGLAVVVPAQTKYSPIPLYYGVLSGTVATYTSGTSIILTAGQGVRFSRNEWITATTGSFVETTQITAISTDTLTLSPALAHGSTASVITPASTPTAGTLPTYTFEKNEAGLYARRFPGCYLGKYNLKGGKEDVAVTLDAVGTVMPVQMSTPTAFAPTANDYLDVSRLYQSNNGSLIANSDPGATGTSSMQALLNVEDWEIDINNNMIEKALWRGSQSYNAYPGTLTCSVKYSYVNTALRSAEWTDYLAQTQSSSTPYPFIMSLFQNIGTAGAPAWQAYGIYAPNVSLTDATDITALKDVIGMQITGEAVSGSGTDIIDFFTIP